ncbi:MAG TPA: hypothetical protein VMV45_09420 [Casimicrobiaceae bacterium]|nr:hypothetical protein [Casimicrobiaceae bacterium]
MHTAMFRRIAVAAFAAALASPAVYAEDAGSGTGSDSGDNGMTPMYGDSWAQLQGRTTPPGVPNLQIYDNADPRGARLHENIRTRIRRLEGREVEEVQSTAPPGAAPVAPSDQSE